jgi:hypothetical protein
MTDRVFRKLRAWAFRRARKGRLYWKQKFFPSGNTYSFKGTLHKDNWVLFGQTKGKHGKILSYFLPHMVWVKSDKFVKIKGNESPYNRNSYWILRSSRYIKWLPTRVSNLFKRQKGLCTYCGKPFHCFKDTEN